jgi:hypothetical protein
LIGVWFVKESEPPNFSCCVRSQIMALHNIQIEWGNLSSWLSGDSYDRQITTRFFFSFIRIPISSKFKSTSREEIWVDMDQIKLGTQTKNKK